MLHKTGFGKTQGNRFAKVHICSFEEQQFIHLVGQRAEICQIDCRECASSKSPLSQFNERPSSLPLCDISKSHRELLLLQLGGKTFWFSEKWFENVVFKSSSLVNVM